MLSRSAKTLSIQANAPLGLERAQYYICIANPPEGAIKLLSYIRVFLILGLTLIAGQAEGYRYASATRGHRLHRDSRTRTSVQVSKLIKALRAQGATVVLTNEKVSQPFFSRTARIINVNGEGVQVFEYAQAAALEQEAKRVSPDGMTIGSSKPSWMATPHFFKRGRLLVLYVGANESILKVLKSGIGSQFAGG